MADPKKIELEIAATGADQAAAEVRKVEAAADNLAGTTGSKGLKSLTEETTKVTRANVQMGTGFQNVGLQVQDLAVQIGSGTSAFRAMGQQLPQLLSGFGPLGITLGTVAAVALPLAGAMFNLGEKTEEAGDKAAEAEEKLEKLTEARAKKFAEESAQDYAQFKAALDDETIAFKRQNDEIQRNIDLLQAKRRAQAEVDSADAALALAKIDASDAPEEEKIRRRAKVQEDLERKRFRDREADAKDRVTAAANRANEASGAAVLKRSAEENEKQRLAEQEAEAARLRGRVNTSNQANARLPELDKKIAENSTPIPFIPGQGNLSEKLEQQRQAELKKLQEERDRTAQEAGSASLADRQRLEVLKGSDGRSGENKALEKSIADLAKAAEALEETARKAQGDFTNTREIETTRLSGDFEATKRRLETNRITSGSAQGKAREEAKEKADRKSDAEELNRRELGLDESARNTAGNFTVAGGKLGGKLGGSLQDIGNKLADGTNQAEIDKLAQQFTAATQGMGGATIAAMKAMLAAQQAQAKEIETLRQQIRNK